MWKNLYILGCLLGGLSWGFVGIFLLSGATAIQKILIILMLAGVTAGSVPLSAAIPIAGIAFLFCSMFPFMITIALLENSTYRLFDLTLTLYIFYTCILTIKAYRLIVNTIILQHQNDSLLNDLEMSNIKLEEAATHDPLTKVANRKLFELNLTKAIHLAKDNQSIFALFYIDLDRFKAVNDHYGHHVGDIILITITERLKNYFNNNDMIARLGGDELAILIEHENDKHNVKLMADEICHLIATPIKINDLTIIQSVSVGISIYPFDGLDGDSLVRFADNNMYYVKSKGGNNYYLSDKIRELEKTVE